MANEYVSYLEASGPAEEVDAFVTQAKDGDCPFSFGSFLKGDAAPGQREPDALYPVEEPQVEAKDASYSTATFTLVTKAGGPRTLTSRLAEAKPNLVFRLATVEPNMRVAEVNVYRGTENWTHEPDDLDWDSFDEEAPEQGAFDALLGESESVVDDYRNAKAPTP